VSDLPATDYRMLSPEELERLDRACDQFEQAWRGSQRPELRLYMEDLDTPVGKVMLRELLMIELAYRVQRGEKPSAEDYKAVFPDHAELIEAAVEETIDQPSADGAGTAPSVAAAVGSSPSGYEILAELGRGGMGVVYKARHLKLTRVVALKMILAGGHAGPAELQRFVTEAEAVAQLQHPNIVQIFESGQHNGLPYFTLEYVSGGTLAEDRPGRFLVSWAVIFAVWATPGQRP
jgi:eukaryotic-like serine/threonine-protein kinase